MGTISEEIYQRKNAETDQEIANLQSQLENIGQQYDRVAQFLDTAQTLISGYILAPDQFQGELLKTISSTPTISATGVDIPKR